MIPRRTHSITPIALIILLVISVLFSLSTGSGFQFISELLVGNKASYYIFSEIRLPRTLVCVLSGAILAWSGVCVQGLFRNPMADPNLLGINSGASVGIIIYFGWISTSKLSFVSPALFAFLGAVVTIGVLWFFSCQKKISTLHLLLMGLGINAGLSAIITIAYLVLPGQTIKNIYFWTIGDCSLAQWHQVYTLFLLLPLVVIFSIRNHRKLDLLSLGNDEAKVAGLNVKWLQKEVLFTLAVCVGVLVSIIGNMGFIALIAPHIVRFWINPKHNTLFIVAPILGAIWLAFADGLSKSVVGIQLPIGAFVTLIGLPFYLFVVFRYVTRNAQYQ